MTQRGPNDPQWIQQAFRQAPWRTQTQATSLVLAVVVIVVVIGALYLAQASRTATIGRRLQEMEAERQQLEQANAQLRAEIAGLQSVPRLISKAEELGYHTADSGQVEYLPVDVAPPLPTANPLLEDSAADVPRYDETLDSWLSEQLAAFRQQMSDFFSRTFSPEEEDGATEDSPEMPESTPEETPDEG